MHRTTSTSSSSSFRISPIKLAACTFISLLALFVIYLLVTLFHPTASDQLLLHQAVDDTSTSSRPKSHLVSKIQHEHDARENEEKERFGFGKEYQEAKREHEVDQGQRDKNSCCSGHLVVVAGFGVFKGSDFVATTRTKSHSSSVLYDEKSWALESFQLGQHIPETILNHISMGLKIVANDPSATLVFTGGQSRKDCGSRSEGGTYLELVLQNFLKNANNIENNPFVRPNGEADDRDFFNEKELSVIHEIVKNQTSLPSESFGRRLLAEEFARDSYENVLFSIARYYQYHGVFPRHVTVVGVEYKRERFVEWHRTAILWPRSWFKYVGVQSKKLDEEIKSGERKQPSDEGTLKRTQNDPYLCKGKNSRKTRLERNPNRNTAPYRLIVPDSVRELMEWCGPKFFYGALPWTTRMNELQ